MENDTVLDEQTMLKIRAIVGRDASRLISSRRTTIISTTNPERSSNLLDGFYKHASLVCRDPYDFCFTDEWERYEAIQPLMRPPKVELNSLIKDRWSKRTSAGSYRGGSNATRNKMKQNRLKRKGK